MINSTIRSTITSVASFYPDTIVTNQDLEKCVDTSDEWIKTRTGIIERRRVTPGQASSDLAVGAIQKILKSKKISPLEIDIILVATITPDTVFPSTACRIQQKIGASRAWGFDISAACSGFVFALATANQFIQSGNAKKIIVVGVDVMSSILDYTDRNTCVLFGDGCGAVLIEPETTDSDLGILDHICHTDGNGADFLYMPAGGSLLGTSHETIEKKMHFVHQEGKSVFKSAVSEMANVCEEILTKNNLSPEDIDIFIPHQANLRIIESCQKKLGLSDDQVIINIERFANTTAGTIPSAMAMAVEDERLTKGKLALITSFGAGFTWGAALIRWSY